VHEEKNQERAHEANDSQGRTRYVASFLQDFSVAHAQLRNGTREVSVSFFVIFVDFFFVFFVVQICKFTVDG